MTYGMQTDVRRPHNGLVDWTRPFGNTGLKVSALGFGTGQIGGQDDDPAILSQALDAGITLIDTARGYGLAEERIGKHIAHRRKEFVLSTKIGYGVEGHDDWTPGCITAGIERALKLMRTDVLDIVHLHSCPLDVLQGSGVIEPLVKAKEAGKVRVAAYSGENQVLAWAADSGCFGSIQTSVNVSDQFSLNEVIPEAMAKGMGVIAKRPVANAPWRFAERPVDTYGEEYWLRWKQMEIDPLGLDWNEVFLRFTAFAPGVSACIVGTKNVQHLRSNLETVKRGPLPAEVTEFIRDAFRRHGRSWEGLV